MKRNCLWLCFILWVFACCSCSRSAYLAQQKFPAEQAQEDFMILRKVLESNHPSLYWYTPKQRVDFLFDSAYRTISDSLSEPELKNKIAAVISQLHCGHTSVHFSKAYTRYLQTDRRPRFPLNIKTWSDSMVVLSSIYRNDSVFKRGTVVTAINGLSARQVLDSMFGFISTDGYADNFKSQVVSFNFPAYYGNTFGTSKEFTINYVDSTGLSKTAIIPAYAIPKRDTSRRRIPGTPLPQPTRKQRRRFELLTRRNLIIDSASRTASIQLNTFSGGKLSDFYYSTFRKLKKDRIQNLIIDLRQNGGGSINNSTLLTRYLINHPFHVADTVATISRRMRYGSYIHPSWLYWLSMHFLSHKKNDGRFHMRILEKHKYKPKKKNHFDGNVFVVQGGYTFSAATMFISSLLHQPNVITVGEETGGGYYGNTAVHLPNIVLPNSRIRVVLPLFQMVFDSTREKTGRGIFPKVIIPPTSASIKAGIDPKLEAVKELIKEKH